MASDDGIQMCRICLSEDQQQPPSAGQLVPIFSQLGEALIANILVECTSVQIREDDGLPDVICLECVEDLRFVAGFVEKTRNSDRMLRKMLKGETKPGLFALEVEFVTEQEADDVVEVKSEISSVDDPQEQEEDEEEEEEEDEQDEEMEFQEETAFVQVDENDSDYSVSEHESDPEPEPEEDEPLEQSPTVRKKPGRKPKSIPKEEDDFESIPLTELDEIEKEIFTIEEVEDQRICCTCLKFFNTVKDLKLHSKKAHEPTRKHNAAKKHVCQYCYRRYASKGALKTHQEKYQLIQQVYVCQKCDARFLDGPKRRTHAHNHVSSIPKHGEDSPTRICCAQGCTQAFESEELLLSHSAIAHKANKVQSELNNAEHRPVECHICYKRFTNENGLRAHQQRVYQPKKHVCSICGMKFHQANDCSRHERQHRDERIFKCEQCSKSYFSEDRLKAHIKRHSATRSFMCNICGMSYLQNHNLQAHMLLHEGKLPFECEICQKGFRVKAKMIYHMRVHSGEKPFPCRYCESAFADSTNRMRHEMSHTGIKPYKCDSCDKTFITKRLKREHENTHHESRLYQCTVCLDTFTKQSNYKAHISKHAADDDEDEVQILLQ